MMKDQELIFFERQFGVGLPLVVGEFDLIGAVQEFHDGSDLAAQQALRRQVRQQRDNVQELRCRVGHLHSLLHETARQTRGRFAAADYPQAANDCGGAIRASHVRVYHVAIAVPVRGRRMCILGCGCCEEQGAKLIGITDSEPEGRRKDPGLVLASRVLRFQAVINKLVPIDDGGISRR